MKAARAKRLRLLLPVFALAILILIVAALGAAAAPRPAHPATPAPPATQHTTLDFEETALDSTDEELQNYSPAPGVFVHRSSRSGDLVRFGEDITIPAGREIRGDVVAVGGSVNVHGIVDGDCVALGGDVRIHSGGAVHGELVSLGGKVLNETGQGMHGPSVSIPTLPKWLFDLNFLNMVGQGIEVIKILFIVLFLVGAAWALAALASVRSEFAIGYLRAHPGAAFLWGLGALIGIAPSAVAVALFCALLCITLIGIPVGILLIVAYAVGLALLILWGLLVGAAVVGRWVHRRVRPLEAEPGLFRALLFGILTLFGPMVLAHLLKSLGFMAPVATGLGIALSVLAGLVCFGFWLVGMGSLVATRAGTPPRTIAPAAGIAGTPPPPAPPAPQPSPAAPPPATA